MFRSEDKMHRGAIDKTDDLEVDILAMEDAGNVGGMHALSARLQIATLRELQAIRAALEKHGRPRQR